jgi:hypothetical protein
MLPLAMLYVCVRFDAMDFIVLMASPNPLVSVDHAVPAAFDSSAAVAGINELDDETDC